MRTDILYPVLIWLICLNIIGFIMAGMDKRWAIRSQWRLAEKWFFRMAVIGGAPGIYLGCLVFHHKIRNRAFMIGIPVIFIVETGLAVLVYKYVVNMS